MPIADDLFLATVRQLLTLIIRVQTDLTATQLALEARGGLEAADVDRHRQALLASPAMQDLRQQLERMQPDTVLEMLRRFEGPPQ